MTRTTVLCLSLVLINIGYVNTQGAGQCGQSTIQICYNCVSAVTTCSSNGQLELAEAYSCQQHVDGSGAVSVYYDPDTSTCHQCAGSDNIAYKLPTQTLTWISRASCVVGCPVFTMTSRPNTLTSITKNDELQYHWNMDLNQCFKLCFDTVDCLTISYGYYSPRGEYICTILSCLPCVSQADSSFTTYERNCYQEDCGQPSSPANGTVTFATGTTQGNEALYTCDVGFTLIGEAIRTCDVSGNWAPTAPSCIVVVDCGQLSSPANGTVTFAAGTTQGNEALYMCDVGFTLIGEALRTCDASGNWAPTAPSCIVIVDCGQPSSPANGTVTFATDTTQGNEALYTCDVGFTLMGEAIRTCDVSGNWAPTASSCNVIDCGAPNAPPNGNVQFSDTTLAGVATYSCQPGYTSTSLMFRTCTNTSQWSDTVPVCISVSPTTPKPNRPLFIMPCLCHATKIWNNLTETQIVQYLITELSIPKNATSRNIYKLKSRPDPRQSSTIVGTVCSLVIISIFGLVFLADIPVLLRHLKAALTGQHELLWRQ